MMKRLAAILLAATCLTPTPAQAEPISTAILTALAIEATATAVAVTTAVLYVAASVAVSLVSSALLSKPSDQAKDSPAGGADLSVSYGAALPRSAVMGPGATGGHHVYTNVYGTTNEAMDCVFVIGDGQHGKLTALKYNGKDVTLPPGGLAHGVVWPVPEFDFLGTHCVGITYYSGRYDQVADASLIAHSNPAGRWTTDHRGRGVAYLYVHQVYAEGDLGLTGIPQLMIETEGLVLYDPRKDDTNGGSGAHRWGLPDTYEPSANPAIQEYNFRRGVLCNSPSGMQRLLGMSMSPVNLILQMYFAAANDNDDPIPLAEGGTEPRYRCSINVSDDRAASDVLSAMRASTAGWSFERGGQFGPVSGVPQTVIASLAFTDDDMIVGASARFTKYRSRSELVTATFGQFADRAQFWVPAAFPPRENPADDAAIGERIAKSLDLTQVYSSSQAQRIAESERRKTLQQGQGVATLPAKWIGVQPGDWLTYNSTRHGTMTVLVTGSTLDTGKQQVTITYERTSSTVYSWTTAGELFPPDVGDPGVRGTLIMIAASMSATGVNLPGDGGLFTPGIHFTWTPIGDPTVEQIDFEIRKVGDSAILPFVAEFPEAGSAVCSGHGIAAATGYEYRHKLYTNPARDTPWSSWLTVTSGTQHVVPGAISTGPPDLSIAVGQVIESQIANAAVTANKLHTDAVTATAFAAGIEPVGIGPTTPVGAPAASGPNTFFNTTEGKLYRWDATATPSPAWLKTTPAALLVDEIVAGQIAAGAVNTSELHSGAVTTDILGAGAVTTLKLAVGTGSPNRVYNSDFMGELKGVWTGGSVTPPAPALSDDWCPRGMRSCWINHAGSPTGYSDLSFNPLNTLGGLTYYPAGAGKRYEASAYLSIHRCAADIAIVFANSAGGYVGEAHGNSVTTIGPSVGNTGGVSDYPRSVVFADAPSGTAFAYLLVRSYYDGQLTPYTFVSGLYFAEANTWQTEATPWGPAGNTIINGGQIITGSVAADKIVANSITAGQITTGSAVITTTAQMGTAVVHSASIGDLQVGTLRIATGAVTQCGINQNGAGTTPGLSYAEILRTNVTVFGTAGEDIVLVVSGGVDQLTVNDVAGVDAILDWYVELIESGALFDSGQNWSKGSVRITFSGGVKFVASASGNTLTARIMAKRASTGFSSSTLANRRITLTAYVK